MAVLPRTAVVIVHGSVNRPRSRHCATSSASASDRTTREGSLSIKLNAPVERNNATQELGGIVAETAELLRAVASLLRVVIGAAVVLVLIRMLLARSGDLKSLGVGPTGLSMEFVERKVDQAISQSEQPNTEAHVGQAARRSVAWRMQRNADLIANAKILWVDDHPENNAAVLDLLRRFDAVVETPRSNAEALALLAGARYDVIISDVARDDEGPDSELKGVELANEVFSRWSQPILLFTARFNPATLPGMSAEARLQLITQLERSVFGRTNRMDVALHLIMDQLER